MVRERVSTTRRDKGSGSLYFDGDKQRWVGQLDLGTDAAGRRIRPRVFGQTRAEVRARMEQLRSAHGTGQDVTVRATTFAELAGLWLARGLSHDLSDNTIANYQSLLRRHVLPAIGHRRVVDLRPEDVERLLDAMALQGYSARSLRLTHAVVRRILRQGERRGVVVRNVASVVETPSGPTSLRKGLTPDQARALLEASEDDRLGGLITVSLLLGLRPGEAAGLTWSSVDLDAEPPTLTIARSLRRDSGRLVLVAPKTPSSHRTLALPRACAEALARQRDIQAQDHRVLGGASRQARRGARAHRRHTPRVTAHPSQSRRPGDPPLYAHPRVAALTEQTHRGMCLRSSRPHRRCISHARLMAMRTARGWARSR